MSDKNVIESYLFDPKHAAKKTKQWLLDNEVNWYPTPPESPDLNPIEMLWHELKEFIRNTYKPHNQKELVEGILQFWSTVTVKKSARNTSAICAKSYQK